MGLEIASTVVGMHGWHTLDLGLIPGTTCSLSRIRVVGVSLILVLNCHRGLSNPLSSIWEAPYHISSSLEM